MIAWDTDMKPRPVLVLGENLAQRAAVIVAQNERDLWKQAAIRNRAKYERTVYVALGSWAVIGLLLYVLITRT